MEDHFYPFLRPAVHHEPDHGEEPLSLLHLPLTPSQSSTAVDHHHDTTISTCSVNQSPPSPADVFEFLISRDDAILSPADDVIFNGRLLPYNPPPPRRSFSLSSASTLSPLTRRFESPLTESIQHGTRSIRHSRSLDCRKLRRNSSSKVELFSPNSSGNNRNNSDSKLPPWYWPVFGVPSRFPQGMELKDIKTRQFRRSVPPVSLFSGDSKRFSGDRGSSASWRMISVLSCKSHASVDVM